MKRNWKPILIVALIAAAVYYLLPSLNFYGLTDAERTAMDLDAPEQLVALQTAAAAQAGRPAPQPKWEYKSIFGDSRVALEEEMNLFGGDGWEFFNIASFGRGTAGFARRPVK